MLAFTGETALVTGAGSGIGAACARLLGGAGGFVYCADRDEPAARAVAAGIGAERALPLRLDVAEESHWDDAAAVLGRSGRRLTILIHAAGISAGGSARDTSFAEWRRVLSVNLDGAFLATRCALQLMGEERGAIVLIGSASGVRPAPGAVGYSVSKAGLAMLARTAAKECRDAGRPIRVNVVSPAGVKTALWRSMPFFQALVAEHGSEEGAFAALAGAGPPFASPESIAQVAVFLASSLADQVTGVELLADGGYAL